MDKALQTWRQRYAVHDDAYRELLSILDPPKISESSTGNGDILSADLQFVSGSWNHPANLQTDASSLSNSALSEINYNLQLDTVAEPNTMSSNWPADNFASADHDFNFLDGDGHLFQGIEQTQLPDEDTLYFCSSNVSTNLIHAPTQLAQTSPSLSEHEQREPACTRCWKWKKAV